MVNDMEEMASQQGTHSLEISSRAIVTDIYRARIDPIDAHSVQTPDGKIWIDRYELPFGRYLITTADGKFLTLRVSPWKEQGK